MSSTQTFLLLSVILDFSAVVHSSHFRGAIMQWRPASPSNYNGEVEFTHRIAWRRSFSGHSCDATTIASRTLIGGSGGSLECTVGCSGTVGILDYYCTDFSSVEDWTSGEKTYTYNMENTTYFEASFLGGAWIRLNEGDGSGSWAVVVKGQLTPRSDNGLINSSPVSATTPIVRLQFECNRVFNIPVQDGDGDVIRCRWAVGPECAGICQAFSPGTLSGCSLTYNGGGSVGLYAVALQIEDFIDSTSTTPLSSVPLQFLVELFSSSQPCNGTKPTLVGETPPDDSCIPVPFGTTVRISVVAMVGDSSVSIVEFPTVSPLGVQRSVVGQSVYSSLLYYTNITWTPQASQFGFNIFCYSARDSNGQTSDQYCITLLGGVQGPIALQNMTSPTGSILGTGSSTTFSIGFDQEIGRPTQNTYIRIYENSGLQVLTVNTASSTVIFPASGSGGRVLSFTTSYSFQSADGYYILLDAGAAVGTAFCNQESVPITDTNFWRFSTIRRVNDSVIGDPLMTVPLYLTNTSALQSNINLGENKVINLCFEIHGRADEYFNLVSDSCVSVNAHYQRANLQLSSNIIDEITVRAAGLDGICRNIAVSVSSCQASINGSVLDETYTSAGISVRMYRNRVRISAPNCQDLELVMWVFCEQTELRGYPELGEPDIVVNVSMIHFVIARGFNIRESAHGLLGQFWNVPITIDRYLGPLKDGSIQDNIYILTVNYPNVPPRRFVTFLHSPTWDRRGKEYCLYGGNRQGGGIFEIESPNDPVIQGQYRDYIVGEQFGVEFAYTHFDSSRCSL